jgi:hypothetical protein
MHIPFIDEYNWIELEQAYGSAEKAPEYLQNLMSEDEDLLDEAINEFLLSQVCHQYTTYSCTPAVLRCVIYIVQNHQCDESLLSELLWFIEACKYNAKSILSLRDEIIKGHELYRELRDHKCQDVREAVLLLDEFCESYK